jgi:hypothetical protein
MCRFRPASVFSLMALTTRSMSLVDEPRRCSRPPAKQGLPMPVERCRALARGTEQIGWRLT